MKATKHYIEELKSGDWRWTHVPLGGLMPSRGPRPSANGQITLGRHQYTVNSDFDHKTVSPRPPWALGVIMLGFMGIVGAAETIQFPIGAITFAIFGIIAILGGLLSYSKSLHIYALFSEGTPMQIPQLRKWIDREKIDEAIGFTSDAIALDAKSQLGREILNPTIPWGMIIMAAIAGLGGGALIGVIAAHVK